MKVGLVFFLLLLQLASMAQSVRLEVKTPDHRRPFIAGAFNNWNPADTTIKPILKAKGKWLFVLPDKFTGQPYKYTTGSWDYVEVSLLGQDVPNRKLPISSSINNTVQDTVLAWKAGRKSTKSDHVKLFSILKKTDGPNAVRTVAVWLPKTNKVAGLPILLMLDGQNLFDDSTAFSGEWGLDELMESRLTAGKPAAIMIGIYNAGANRLKEYTPLPHPVYGGGGGSQHLDWIADTLLPNLTATLPPGTLDGPVFIGGSSLGGLMAAYAFSHKLGQKCAGALVFSPAFWILGDSINTQLPGLVKQKKIYVLVGGQESETMVPLAKKYAQATQNSGAKLKFREVPTGKHQEDFWRREISGALDYLLSK